MSEQSRHPTSHERRFGQPWDASYRDGPAPWDIGRPQPTIVRLAAEGAFLGPVLDAGCGSGEHALHIASTGVPVLGVDVAETALALARDKAAERGLDAEFAAADALDLGQLDRTFRTVLDCGLFHTFDDEERRRYVAGLAAVTAQGAMLYVLSLGDQGPEVGPHPVSQDELHRSFHEDAGWRLVAIEPDRIHTNFAPDGLPAWLATVTRL